MHDSLQELFTSLRQALSLNSSLWSIEFVKNERVLLVKPKQFKVKWEIPLDLVELTTDEKMILLNNRLADLSVRFDRILPGAPAPEWQVLHPTFSSAIVSDHIIAADRRSVTREGETRGHQGFIAEQALPAGRSKFVVQLAELGVTKHVSVGLAERTCSTAEALYKGSAWMFFVKDGYVRGARRDPALVLDPKSVPLANGDRLGLLFDSESRVLTFELNGFLLPAVYRLPPPSNNTALLCPAIDLFEPSHSVVFL